MKYNEPVETIISKKFDTLVEHTFCFVCNEYLPVGTECVVVVSEYEGEQVTTGMHTECSDFNDFVLLINSNEVNLD
jgi:predicted Zn-dependent protease with MMP-like domain